MQLNKDARDTEEYRQLAAAMGTPLWQIGLALVGGLTVIAVLVGFFI